MFVDNYLFLILVLMVFFYILMLYKQRSKFTPGVPTSKMQHLTRSRPNVYNTQDTQDTQDTRNHFPLLPPVNPIARLRTVQNVIPIEQDLYSSQSYDNFNYVLDTPYTQDTNSLVYSGGDTQLIKVPLQFNTPYNEQLRSQDILITPYNKVKYSI